MANPNLLSLLFLVLTFSACTPSGTAPRHGTESDIHRDKHFPNITHAVTAYGLAVVDELSDDNTLVAAAQKFSAEEHDDHQEEGKPHGFILILPATKDHSGNYAQPIVSMAPGKDYFYQFLYRFILHDNILEVSKSEAKLNSPVRVNIAVEDELLDFLAAKLEGTMSQHFIILQGKGFP